MAKVTISEGIGILKTLRERHGELVGLRNENSNKQTRYFGANAEKDKVTEPVYDVKALDRLISSVAGEIRKLDTAIKAANAVTMVGYEWDDSKMGEVS